MAEIPPDNPFFTGREALLDEIHSRLTRKKTTAITQRQAISGLGGIGKTQLAVKYAHRYAQDYKQVFWVIADSRETIIQEYVKIAEKLELPERNDKDQQLIVAAVMHWLETHSDWLFVLDNADDLKIVQEYIPNAMNGHLLLTTRAQALDRIAESIEIDKMRLEEGKLFLLRRAKVIPADKPITAANQNDQAYAEKIVQKLDGLPLALDQASAYIEETGASLGDYVRLYQDLGVRLLQERRGISNEHPESVIKTFLLAFNKVERNSVTAANLLRLCAFLAPDDIPESLVADHLPSLIVARNTPAPPPQNHKIAGIPIPKFWSSPGKPPPLSWAESRSMLDDGSEVLRRLSLIRREKGTLAVHRLVQAVLKESMPENMQCQWAENAIRIVNDAFPDATDVNTWPECQRLLPHALSCVPLINRYNLTRPEASQLLNKAGLYLTERAQYPEAQPLYEKALKIREMGGGKGPLLAESQHNLAELYRRQGNYSQAERLFKHALRIREQVLGAYDPDTASSLNSLAELYKSHNKLADAEPLYQRALDINRRELGLEDAATSKSLNNLATLYMEQNKYADAERLYNQALDISEKVLGKDHPYTANVLHDFAELYKRQGKLTGAESLHTRALQIRERMKGEEHPDTATSLNSIAELRELQGNTEDAERLYKQALTIREKALGRDHPDTAASLYSLAGFYKGQGKTTEAEQHYQQALSIREKKLGLNDRLTMQNQKDLADLYVSEQQIEKAKALTKHGLEKRRRKLRADDPTIAQNQQDLAALYEESPNKYGELEQLYEQAFEERSKKLGIHHSSTKQSLLELMKHYESQSKTEKIERLQKQVFEMRAQKLRGDYPESIQSFEQSVQELTRLYDEQDKREEKQLLYEQALKACYEKLGLDDPLSRKYYHDLMEIYKGQGESKRDKAGQLYKQEFERRRQALRKDDPASVQHYLDSQHMLVTFSEKQKEFEGAEHWHEQALETSYQELGVDHPRTIQELHSLVQLYESHKKFAEGARIYKQDVEICRRMHKLGLEHPRTIESQNNLASYYLSHKKYEEAKPLVKEMLHLCEPTLEENYLSFEGKHLSKEYIQAAVHSLTNAALLYQETYKDKQVLERAEKLLQKALKVSEEMLDKEHQDTVRKSYIDFLLKMGRPVEAAALKINATMMKKQERENGEPELPPEA